MAGIGDFLGLAARTATQAALNKKNFINKVINSSVGQSVADAANNLLVKARVQREDGSLIIRLPFLKSVEDNTRKILAIHPDRQKLFIHLGDTICEECTFYDIEGQVLFQINKSSKNTKHILLLKDSDTVGELQKKTELIKNPLQDKYKFSVHLNGSDLGCIIVDDSFMKTYAKPDFDSWEMKQKGIHSYEVLDKEEKEIASIYYPGDSTYIFESSESFDLSLLVLSFLAIQMRREHQKKIYERERRIDNITRPLKPWH